MIVKLQKLEWSGIDFEFDELKNECEIIKNKDKTFTIKKEFDILKSTFNKYLNEKENPMKAGFIHYEYKNKNVFATINMKQDNDFIFDKLKCKISISGILKEH